MDGIASQILDAIPNLVFAKDRAGRYTLVSRSFAEAYGSTPEAMLGRTEEETGVAPELAAEWRRVDLQVMDTRQDFFIPEERFVDGAGKLRWLQTHKRPVIDADGVVRQVLAVSTDVTARRDAQFASEQLAAIVNSSTEAIISSDMEGCITSWNPAAERMFGYSRLEMLGRHFSVLHPEGPARLAAVLADVRAGVFVHDLEQLRVRKDGSPVEISLTHFPLREVDGAIVGLSAVARDISELRRANEALAAHQRFLRQVIDTMPNFLFAKDCAGRYTLANRAIAEAFGLTVEEMVGKTDADLNPDAEQVASFRRGDLRAMDSLEPWHVDEEPMTDVTGAARWFQTVRRPIQSAEDGAYMLLGVSTDITLRREAQQAAQVALRAAEAANIAKSEFLTNMSHELRTPLGSIIGFTNVLRKNKRGNLKPADLKFLDRIQTNGMHLLGLIDEILDLAKLESGKTDIRRASTDVGRLVTEVAQLLEGQTMTKPVSLVVDVPAELVVLELDAENLKRVLINLAGNAVKFTAAGTVTLRLTRATHDGAAQVEVVDTGIGIPAERLSTIFEPFEQAGASTTKTHGGTGLGLSISRALCAAMGCALSVESTVGVGSTFRVLLPAHAPVEPGMARAA
jgi:two-component system sensor histidine kinase/response regulator